MQKNKVKRFAYTAGLIVFLCIATVYSLSWKFAKGGRTFFSPDTLETKSQSETLLFLTSVPIYRSSYQYHRYELVDFLIAEGYWTPSAAPSPRWLGTNRSNAQWRDGQSPIHREFAWFADDWIAWTQAHPELAAVLWPLVLEELRSGNTECQWNAYRWMSYAELAQDIKTFENLLETAD